MSGAANDGAVYFVFAGFIGLKTHLRRLSGLDRLINPKVLNGKTMLHVAGRNLEHHILSLFYVDHGGLKAVAMSGYLNMYRLGVRLPVATCQDDTDEEQAQCNHFPYQSFPPAGMPAPETQAKS
jgi:hypothetical protein